jgi:hypothetical protein
MRRLSACGRPLAALTLAALASACAHPPRMGDTPVPVLQQRHATQCPWPGEGAALFDDEAAWRRALGEAAASVFEAPVDWAGQRVLAYSMGTQPSLGYGIELLAAQVVQRGEVLRLPVRLQRPSPDRMHGAALTQPCLFVVVPKGSWRTLEVRDADGDVQIGTARIGR